MARKPEGVELIISAKDESEKTFAEVINAFKELEKAAKGGAGITGLFVGLEKRLEILAKRQETVNKALGDTKSIQRGLDAANKFTDALEAQEKAAAKAQQRLSRLEEEFAGIEEAANAARQPSERLVESLAKQEARRDSLGKKITETTDKLAKANAELERNAGLDDKASAALAKQEKSVTQAGQAWRATTQQIKEANNTLKSAQGERDLLAPLRDQAVAKLKELQSELKRVETASKAFDRAAQREGSGAAVQAMARSAKAHLANLRAEIDQQKTVVSSLDSQLKGLNRTITQQTTTIDKLTAKARDQKTAYTELKAGLAGYEAQLRSEGSARQLASIESIRTALDGLQAEYGQTAAKIEKAQQAIAAASAPDPKAIAQRDAYRKRIAEALDAVRQEQAELTRLKSTLDQAGISADALASRQRELDRVTTELTQEQSKLNNQVKALGGSSKRASAGVRSIGDAIKAMSRDTRQSLSYLQRLRGEFLSILAAYSGFRAVGGAVRSIYETSVLLNKAEARFSTAFGGDAQKVAAEMKFVRDESDRLKISFETSLDQYSKFVAGLPPGVASLKEIRTVFSGFATAARVAGLGTQELERIFNAVGQIFSKQQVQLEELKGQLGDALPGAVAATARAMGTDPKSLFKQIEAGNLGFEAAILLADELAKQYSGALPQALRSPAAAMADFQNQLSLIRKEMAEAGFIEVLTEALRDLVKEMKTPEFRKGARDIAAALAGMIRMATDFVKNFESIKEVLIAVAGVMAARVFINFSSKFIKAGGAVTKFGGDLTNAAPRLGNFIKLTGMLASSLPALAAGFAFGTYLQSQSAEVQKFGVALVAGFKKLGVDIQEFWDKLIAGVKDKWRRAKDEIGEIISDPIGALEIVTNPVGALITGKLDSSIGALETLTNPVGSLVTGKRDLSKNSGPDPFADIEARAKAAKEEIDRIAVEMFKNIDDEFAKRDGKGKGNKPDLVGVDQIKKDAEEAKKVLEGLLNEAERLDLKNRANRKGDESDVLTPEQLKELQQKVADALAKIDAEIQEKSADTLEQRLEAIRVEYAKLQRQIEQAGGAQAFPKAQSSIDQIVAIKQVAETEKEINRLIQERRQYATAINEQMELGAITVEEAIIRINENNAKTLPQLTTALATAQQIASTVNSVPINQSVDAQAQVVALEQQRAKKNELVMLEQEINRQMAIRAERIQTINALVETGSLSEAKGRIEILRINMETKQQLDELIARSQALATSMGDVQILERLKQIEAQLKLVKEQMIDWSGTAEDFSSGFAGAMDEYISRVKDADHAFGDFALSFLRNIAKMITQALVLKAIQAAIGYQAGGGTDASGLGGASTYANYAHTGGIVGQLSVRRKVPVTAFANAVKYHTGGVAGLKPDEVPTVLQRGEEILTADDPRHRNNGGMGGNSSPIQLKIVNAIDSVSVMKEAMSSAEGVKVIANAMQANKSTFKSVLA